MANERKIIAEIQSPDEINFEYHVQVLIVGAGACGLTAALAANDNTNDILVLERDSILGGSTAYPQDLSQLHRPKVNFL